MCFFELSLVCKVAVFILSYYKFTKGKENISLELHDRFIVLGLQKHIKRQISAHFVGILGLPVSTD